MPGTNHAGASSLSNLAGHFEPMDYFYTPPENISATSLVIDGEEFAHLVHVMRKKEGDQICVVDGRGASFSLEIPKGKRFMIHSRLFTEEESNNREELFYAE